MYLSARITATKHKNPDKMLLSEEATDAIESSSHVWIGDVAA